LSDSEPEPDLAIVHGNVRSYLTRHPAAQDVGKIIEVADSTLPGDRLDKGRIYARAGLAIYWIINLVDRQIEVYENPSGPTPTPAYATHTIYHSADLVPLVLAGKVVTMIAVHDFLP
jgi:Uma2 family endonuclease